jgi:TonB-dependent receptor
MTKSAKFKLTPVSAAVTTALLAGATQSTALAQEEIEEIVVTGIRGSLQNSMNVKRNATGVVDAITAEDIGKFPDTNLAESLQRITGISIERRDGEGAQVTARGFGPEYNMVTLNGRQIPGADGFGNGGLEIGGIGAGTRAFNFAQLSSDAIAGITVYKTGRASIPSGGIGATIDILTDRPLNHDGMVLNVGAKAVSDDSQVFASDITPELTGIFSWANDSGTLGVGVNGSYQERDGGSVQATENYWNIQEWTGTDPALRPDANVQNAPAIGQLYGMPNDMRYAFSEFHRERTNGQAVIQFAPSDAWLITADYTFGTNELTENRGEQTTWLQRGSSFTDLVFDTNEAVATPVYIREITPQTKDYGFEQQRNSQEYKFDSLGLNVEWAMNDRLSFAFDAHQSTSESNPNDPLTGASATFFSVAGTACSLGVCPGIWTQEFNINEGMPIVSRTYYPSEQDAVNDTNGVVNRDFNENEVSSQIARTWYTAQESEATQARLDGTLEFDDGRFKFGVDSTKVTMKRQTSTTYATMGDWGANFAGQEPGMMALLDPISITNQFDDWDASGAAPGAWAGDTEALTLWGAAEYGIPTRYNPNWENDNEIEEESFAAYIQVELEGELGGMQTSTVLGIRYEDTDVTSVSAVAIPSAIQWISNNDFQLLRSTDIQPFNASASYDHVLPSLDFSIDFTDQIKGRASFSNTIARAPYGNLYSGPEPNNPSGSILINPSTRASANSQNPGLVPLESANLDLAVEWYFSEDGYASITYWDKRVDNFIGNSVVREPLYGLTDPTSGPDAQAALDFITSDQCVAQVTAAGEDVGSACSANDTSLFTAVALLRNAAETGGLAAYNGSGTQILQMEADYDLYGEPDDPLYQYDVNRPTNQNDANINGWEIGGQYFFGDTGFGVYANYTLVNGDVGFDDAGDPGVDQFALLGLSDTANVMLMYENYGFSARLAYNWRDEYLFDANNGGSRNPIYVEAYDQFDLNVSYYFTDDLSAGFEVINLTGEDVRWHNRSEKQIVKLLEQSPRYMLGVRYNFGF